MQAPNSLMNRNGLHALTRKLVTEVLVSVLATFLVMVIFSNVTKPTPPFARDNGRLSSVDEGLPGGETTETMADFMEHVALSHVAALKAPPDATTAPAAAAVSRPPRLTAAARRDRLSSGKAHVAAGVPKAPSSAPPVQTVEAAAEPAVASAPAEMDWLNPIQYGKHLVTNIENIVAASNTRVVEGVASVGNALTSLAKKFSL